MECLRTKNPELCRNVISSFKFLYLLGSCSKLQRLGLLVLKPVEHLDTTDIKGKCIDSSHVKQPVVPFLRLYIYIYFSLRAVEVSFPIFIFMDSRLLHYFVVRLLPLQSNIIVETSHHFKNIFNQILYTLSTEEAGSIFVMRLIEIVDCKC